MNEPSAGEKTGISHSSVVIRERSVRSAIGGRNCIIGCTVVPTVPELIFGGNG